MGQIRVLVCGCVYIYVLMCECSVFLFTWRGGRGGTRGPGGSGVVTLEVVANITY